MVDSNLRILPVAFHADRSSAPVESNQPQLPGAAPSPEVLEFNWHKLTALGVAPEDARAIVHTLEIKKTMSLYWRKLIRIGVPLDDARRVARAIAKYDAAGILPTVHQQALVRQYCPLVCRAGLWRVELLLAARS